VLLGAVMLIPSVRGISSSTRSPPAFNQFRQQLAEWVRIISPVRKEAANRGMAA